MSTKIINFDPTTLGVSIDVAKNMQIAFEPMFQRMTDLEEKYNAIVAHSEITPDLVVQAKELHRTYRKITNETAAIHKREKAEFRLKGLVVDGFKNAQILASEPKEQNLKKIIDHFENVAKEKAEALRIKRVDLLAQFNLQNVEHMALGEMSEDIFNTMLKGAEASFKEAEKERVDQEERQRKIIEDQNIFDDRKNILFKFGAQSNISSLILGMSDEAFESLNEKAESEYKIERKRLKDLEDENERLKKESEDKAIEAQRIETLWRGRIRELNGIIWDGQGAKYKDEYVVSYEDLISISDAQFKKIKISHNKVQKADQKVIDDQNAESERLREAAKQKQIDDQKEVDRKNAITKDGDKAIMNEWLLWFGEPVSPEGLKSKESKATHQLITTKYKSFLSWASSEVSKIK